MIIPPPTKSLLMGLLYFSVASRIIAIVLFAIGARPPSLLKVVVNTLLGTFMSLEKLVK